MHIMQSFQRKTSWLAALCAAGLLWSSAGEAQARKLGTCGPPPRKNPQRQNAAEGVPPLPLPATPLRRSEPKAEPSPPLMMAKLEYGTTQDWNTDPGDADNLMRHCRYELNLWYGYKYWNIDELVAMIKKGEKCKIPILYISGHEAFQFTPNQRAALREYLIDGGTLIGDACCGRKEFFQSFSNEVRAMFPKRSFDLLQTDHPVFHAYYDYTNVHYRTYDRPGGVQNDFEGPPQLLGMNLGCRTAIMLTPYDLSCGWDEHVHDHGSRVLPGDAIRLGINMVSYVAAMRKLGEVQAVTREVRGPEERPREQFVFAQLRHQGDWNPDPNSTYQLLRDLSADTSLAVKFELKAVDPTESQIAAYPFLYLTGHKDPRFTAEQVRAIRRHLDASGFLLINNCCGRSEFDQAARALIKRIYPDQELQALKSDSPIYSSFYTIKDVRDRHTGGVRPAELEGLSVHHRLVLIYSKNDMITQLKQVSDPFGNGFDAASCKKLALNILTYAMQN